MGVKELWSLLRSANLVQEYYGSHDHPRVATEVQGKVIAVDTSHWIFHANSQPELLATFTSPEARCLKVAFERVSVWQSSSPVLSRTYRRGLASSICQSAEKLYD